MKRTTLIALACCLLASSHLRSESLDKYERIFALSSIWKEMNYSFAFPDKLFGRLNMDSLYRAYLPLVEQETDTYRVYKLLSAYMANFNEGHTRMQASSKIVDTPPVILTNIDDRIVVENVSKDLVREIPIGSEITKVDGIPVRDYIADSVSVYISASTSHWKWNKSVIELLSGKSNTQVSVTVTSPDGKEKEVLLQRNYNQLKKSIELVKKEVPISIQYLKGGIAYLKLDSFLDFYGDTINETFLSNVEKLRQCKGLIIDVRKNRGGSDSCWNLIAKYLLIDKSFSVPVKTYSRKYIPAYIQLGMYIPALNDFTKGTAMEEIQYGYFENEIPDSQKLLQPLVILSGKHTGSAAEDFVATMRFLRKTPVVGMASSGCMNVPSFYPINNEFGFTICTQKYILPDGTQPIDTGIVPDIFVEEEFEKYRAGEDAALERALDELSKLLS